MENRLSISVDGHQWPIVNEALASPCRWGQKEIGQKIQTA
jgi:hypothetical protein